MSCAAALSVRCFGDWHAYVLIFPKVPSVESAWMVPSTGLAGGHGVQHGDDLVAQDLADDHPSRVMPVGPLHQVVHGDRPLAFGVGLSGLPRHAVRVAMQLVEAELVGQLDGDDPVRWVGLGRERAQHVVLPASVPPETIMFSRARTQPEEAGQLVGHRVRQVREGGVDETVTSDRHTRPVRHLDHRGEPVTAGQVATIGLALSILRSPPV